MLTTTKVVYPTSFPPAFGYVKPFTAIVMVGSRARLCQYGNIFYNITSRMYEI